MASIAVSASTGVMSSLLSKLSMLLSDQYKQLKGVRKDIAFLSRELIDMNAALEKLADMEKLEVQTKAWRDKVREMAYDIEDCIDVFMHHLGQGDEKDGLFNKTARKIRKLRVRYQIAGMIQDLKARVVEQSQSRDRYKIDESISKPRVVEIDPRLPALFEEAKRLVGIDGPREEITKWLMEEGDGNFEQLKVVSIVGFGGLGKTTLANQVYNKIKDKFECKAFVSVSRNPDMPKILKDILSAIGHGSIEMLDDDVQKLIMILRAQLTNKRYLIVIDDLWSTKAWDTIKCALVQTDEGCRVITTTRIQDVATACCFPCDGHVYHMQPLNELDSRSLFFKRVFGREDSCPQQFKEISDDMLRKCKGVPLAITSIASLLANQSMHVETWEKIRNSLGSELGTNPTLEWMRHVLSLSYNDLSHELKTCLLYLGTYPEDHAVKKFDLVTKWIAEGFIREKHGLDVEEVAENCYNELINRSMIQASSFDDATSDVFGTCRVHDLMLDLIISKCTEENFITIVDKQFNNNGGSQVRRISHQFNSTDVALAVERISLSQVRSYKSFHPSDCLPLLSKFELLRVLDLKGDSESMSLDLSAVNHLFLLRYLKIEGFHLELPKKFGKLKHLMTLDMSSARLSSTSNQSSDFTSLSSLRHLTLPVGGYVGLRNGLSKLCNLRTLWCFNIRTSSIDCIRDLGELTNLRDLTVYYSPGDVEDNLDTVLADSLDKLGNNNLREIAGLDKHGGATARPTQLWTNCFTSPRHLRNFYLDGLMPKVPNWLARADRLAYLERLEVQELWSVDFQVLARLPSLVSMNLSVKTIPEKGITMHPNTFPSLKYFDFSCELSCLTFEPATMPRLQKLRITLDGCRPGVEQPQKESCPLAGIEHLASLEKISVHIRVQRGHGSKLESECREVIIRHPKSHVIQIHVSFTEYNEDGNMINSGRQQSLESEEKD